VSAFESKGKGKGSGFI